MKEIQPTHTRIHSVCMYHREREREVVVGREGQSRLGVGGAVGDGTVRGWMAHRGVMWQGNGGMLCLARDRDRGCGSSGLWLLPEEMGCRRWLRGGRRMWPAAVVGRGRRRLVLGLGFRDIKDYIYRVS